jgi:predicted RNA-binding Zn ribbon-like protein
MEANQDIFKLRLDGGNLSLNFVNTVEYRHEEFAVDFLHHYLDLITWAYFADAVGDSQKEMLLGLSQEKGYEAKQIYDEAIQLRDTMYEYIVNLIARDEVPQASMQLINQWISKAFSNLELRLVDGNFMLDWNADNFGLESVLWPIINSFVDLVTSKNPKRIKQCSNCGWVFVDNSKNNSRRWCSMEICGNRVKARRFAKKTQS